MKLVRKLPDDTKKLISDAIKSDSAPISCKDASKKKGKKGDSDTSLLADLDNKRMDILLESIQRHLLPAFPIGPRFVRCNKQHKSGPRSTLPRSHRCASIVTSESSSTRARTVPGTTWTAWPTVSTCSVR